MCFFFLLAAKGGLRSLPGFSDGPGSEVEGASLASLETPLGGGGRGVSLLLGIAAFRSPYKEPAGSSGLFALQRSVCVCVCVCLFYFFPRCMWLSLRMAAASSRRAAPLRQANNIRDGIKGLGFIGFRGVSCDEASTTLRKSGS